jgi:hypothetical protein
MTTGPTDPNHGDEHITIYEEGNRVLKLSFSAPC